MRQYLELVIRFAAPLAYAGAVPMLYRLHPEAPLGLAALLPIVLIAAHHLPVNASPGPMPHHLRRFTVRTTIAVYLALIVWGAATAGHDGHALLLAIPIGLGAGIFAMLAAHEMIHSPFHRDKAVGLVMLTAMSYRHFRMSHLYGHHRWAATPHDPTTARHGENAYGFIWRSIWTQVTQSYQLEQRRLARRGASFWGNRVLQDAALYVVIFTALEAAYGSNAVVFQALQSAFAIVVLELFNYVAHYGLLRGELGHEFEPLRPIHSWNATGTVGNWLLLDMGHHATHHRVPRQVSAPVAGESILTLPGGYAGAIVLALVPPVWQRCMDRRLARCLADDTLLASMAARVARAVPVLAICIMAMGLAACGGARMPPLPTDQRASATDSDAVKRGAYLAAAANCVSCHTDKKNNGALFAGGGMVVTDFGIYYARNITPDRDHGIGTWSDAAFLRAIRSGISPAGDYYFPAFPYPAFTGMSDRDILDIKAYLMTQKPSGAPNKKHAVGFPYNSRTAMGFWRMLYFNEGPMKPDPAKSDEWNRGNYLVNAVSHCAECHSPRNSLGAISDKRRFTGGKLATPGGKPVPNYSTKAPNITTHKANGIGKWSVENIVHFLHLGQRPDGDFVAAPMAEVIDGTAKLSDADRRAMAVYLKSLPALSGGG